MCEHSSYLAGLGLGIGFQKNPQQGWDMGLHVYGFGIEFFASLGIKSVLLIN